MLPGNFVPPESSPGSPAATTADPACTPPPENLGRHVPCLCCGYDLHGLPSQAICPECTFPAAHSRAEDDRLPKPYFRALFWSVWLTLAPSVVAALLIALAIADAIEPAFGTLPLAGNLFRNAPLSLIPWAFGVFWLSALRPPDAERPEPARRTRRLTELIHFAVTTAFCGCVIWLMYFRDGWNLTPWGSGNGLHPAWIPTIICGQTIILRQMLASIGLAARLHSSRLHDSAWAVLLCSIPVSVLALATATNLIDRLPMEQLKFLCYAMLVGGAIGGFLALIGVCLHTRIALMAVGLSRKTLIRQEQARAHGIAPSPHTQSLSNHTPP